MALWFKRYPRDALNGMRGMSYEERGCYDMILDLIYEEDGPITEAMCRHESASPRKWPAMRDRLIALGKIVQLPDGRITNARATFELGLLKLDSAERSASGAKGGRTRAAREAALRAVHGDLFERQTGSELQANSPVKSDLSQRKVGGRSGVRSENANEINGRVQAQPNLARAQDIDIDIEEEPPTGPPPDLDGKSRKRSKRAQPLPIDWVPSELTGTAKAIVERWAEGEFETEVERFTNYALANGRTCKDWDAALRNWLIQAEQYRNDRSERRMMAHERPSGWRFS